MCSGYIKHTGTYGTADEMLSDTETNNLNFARIQVFTVTTYTCCYCFVVDTTKWNVHEWLQRMIINSHWMLRRCDWSVMRRITVISTFFLIEFNPFNTYCRYNDFNSPRRYQRNDKTVYRIICSSPRQNVFGVAHWVRPPTRPQQ